MESDLIQCDPDIMMGNPVVAGTLLTVELILGGLAVDHSIEDLLDAWPSSHPRLSSPPVQPIAYHPSHGFNSTFPQLPVICSSQASWTRLNGKVWVTS